MVDLIAIYLQYLFASNSVYFKVHASSPIQKEEGGESYTVKMREHPNSLNIPSV